VLKIDVPKQRVRVRHLASPDLDRLRHHFSLSDCSFIIHTSLSKQPGNPGHIGISSRWFLVVSRQVFTRFSYNIHPLIMPTESVIPPPTPPSQSPDINFNFPSTNPGVLKCSLCGVSGLASSSISPLHGHEGIVLLNDPIERLCGGCVRAQDIRQRMEEAVSEEGDLLALGLGLRGVRVNDGSSGSSPIPEAGGRSPVEGSEEEPSKHMTVPPETDRTSSQDTSPHTPIEPAQIWRHSPSPTGASDHPTDTKPDDTVPIRILEVCKSRINSKGKGALHPGATFKGTQTSGRSAYEVEVKIAVRLIKLIWTHS